MSPVRLEDSYSVRTRHLQTRTRLVLAKSGLDPSLLLTVRPPPEHAPSSPSLPLPQPPRRRALYEWRQQDENWKRDHRNKGADGSTEDFYGVHCFFFRCRLLERSDVIKHGLAKLFCQLALTRTLRIASLEFWQKVNFLDFLQKNIGLWRLKLFFVCSFFRYGKQ